MPSPSLPTGGECSAKGCRRAATWALSWNNPRLHGPDRRKVWLACTEHRARLGDFLAGRGFLRETAALPAAAGQDPDGTVSQDRHGPG